MRELQRILHVDDAEDIRVIADIALKLIGQFELLQCDSGKQALEQAEAFRPDLFLLDYMMPDMDGKETLLELRKLPGLSDVPVVFMTARVNGDFADSLRSDGALAVIAKPFDPMDLADQLRALWQTHTGL
ncbi:MAG: response regulator [Pseudotabrizicola sp.]|uniref:response regulator n=1 Tax=Pseudotabrizicola sp. TaxID=2939647 RepID=UPI0027286DF2|nr:response regulator [Pseudotabrizicola sp.]MDO8882433.1 response regulator [Pseudotabrizicola sp.]MDP2081527.1 response regulator [Pseudotabrizicola sp.]MDZ7575730.1 response regulator [Pseudotabrizicola sp.]